MIENKKPSLSKATQWPQSVSVVGAGAIGTFYGALIKKNTNARVSFQSTYAAKYFADKNTLAQKVEISSIWGDFTSPAQYVSTIEELPPASLIIISAKQLPHFPWEKIKPLVMEQTVLLVLQNGINTEERLARMFPNVPIIGGLAFTCINRISAQKIEHRDYGLIKLAPLKDQYMPQAKSTHSFFREAKIEVQLETNLRKNRWEKLLWNIPFNTLSVLLGGVSTDKIMASAHATNLALGLMNETIKIANSEGVGFDESLTKGMLERTRSMRPYKTSMLLDFENQRPMEIESILGEPMRLARKNNIKTPLLDCVYSMASFINSQILDLHGM